MLPPMNDRRKGWNWSFVAAGAAVELQIVEGIE
jgi:hypothetical protein